MTVVPNPVHALFHGRVIEVESGNGLDPMVPRELARVRYRSVARGPWWCPGAFSPRTSRRVGLPTHRGVSLIPRYTHEAVREHYEDAGPTGSRYMWRRPQNGLVGRRVLLRDTPAVGVIRDAEAVTGPYGASAPAPTRDVFGQLKRFRMGDSRAHPASRDNPNVSPPSVIHPRAGARTMIAHRYPGTTDALAGTPSHGGTLADAPEAVGPPTAGEQPTAQAPPSQETPVTTYAADPAPLLPGPWGQPGTTRLNLAAESATDAVAAQAAADAAQRDRTMAVVKPVGVAVAGSIVLVGLIRMFTGGR